jgi:prepilin-type N-terminal cleavage/methylation domain-containing protein
VIQRLRRSESGYSLVEMLTVLVILGIVIGGLTTLFEQGSNAEIDMNYRFQAQQDARVALDRMRRDLHCASAATTVSSTAVTVTDPCASGSQVSWCVLTLNGRQGLFRQVGASACATSSQRFADYVKTGSTYFAYQGSSTSSLAKLYVCVPVNVKPKRSVDTYALQDAIVLRNSTRTGSASTVSKPSCP